jgi:hypothetical protein
MTLRTRVFLKAREKSFIPNISLKFSSPIQGLLATPANILYSLNAIFTPYIGIYLKMI